MSQFLVSVQLVPGLAVDIDLPAEQTRGQFDVLALAADGRSQLIIGNDDFEKVLGLVHNDAGDDSRSHGVLRVGFDVRAPDHDVDALTVQFLHDVLDAGAPDAHAGAHGIHVAVAGDNGDLGAGAGIAGHAENLDDALVDFRHLAAEEGGEVIAVGAGHHDLRAADVLAYVDNDGLNLIAAFVVLLGDLLLARQNGLGAAEGNDPAALVAALHRAGNDLANAVLELVKDLGLLRVAHALDDDLLGGLGGDAAEILDVHAEAHLVVELDRGIVLPGVGNGDLRVLVGHVVVRHHDLELVDFDVAGFLVVRDFDVDILAVAAQHRGAYGLLQRLDEHIAIQASVLADLINGLFQFKIHEFFPF